MLVCYLSLNEDKAVGVSNDTTMLVMFVLFISQCCLISTVNNNNDNNYKLIKQLYIDYKSQMFLLPFNSLLKHDLSCVIVTD